MGDPLSRETTFRARPLLRVTWSPHAGGLKSLAWLGYEKLSTEHLSGVSMPFFFLLKVWSRKLDVKGNLSPIRKGRRQYIASWHLFLYRGWRLGIIAFHIIDLLQKFLLPHKLLLHCQQLSG